MFNSPFQKKFLLFKWDFFLIYTKLYKIAKSLHFCPISILASFSNIFKKLIFTQLYSSLTKVWFYFQLNTVINHNKFTGLIMLDLTKAFDTVNLELLLNKLRHYGIRKNAHRSISFYLANRLQYVGVNKLNFFLRRIEYGVRQKSTLSPSYF